MSPLANIGNICHGLKTRISLHLWGLALITDCARRRKSRVRPQFADFTLSEAVSVNCSDQNWNINVDLDIVRKFYPATLTSGLYLGQITCKGTEDDDILSFQQGLRECFTSEIVSRFYGFVHI